MMQRHCDTSASTVLFRFWTIRRLDPLPPQPPHYIQRHFDTTLLRDFKQHALMANRIDLPNV
jgi:hypothetical protein